MLRSASWVAQVLFVFRLQIILKPYVGKTLAIANRSSTISDMARRAVDERKIRGSDHQDIVAQLLRVQQDKPQLDDESIVSTATAGIIASSDTTAIAMRAIVYYLLHSPACKERLVAEIDARRAEGRFSDPVTVAEADSMPHHQAVMFEALRLHPSIGMNLPRVVSEGGVMLGESDTFIPAGTIIGASAWVIHRNQDIFGPDVKAFRPERWYHEDGTRNGRMHRYFFAFGAGARVCLGRNISWLEMSKLIPTLFMHYDLELKMDLEEGKEWETRTWFISFNFGLKARLVPREKTS